MRRQCSGRLLLGDAYTPLYPEISTVAIEGPETIDGDGELVKSSFARSAPWANRGEFFAGKAQATLSEPYFLLLSQSMMFSANTA
jgi:hypothetical protein